MTNPLLEEIEKLGTLDDNWTHLRKVLKDILTEIPGVKLYDGESSTETEEKADTITEPDKRKKRKKA